MASDLDDVKHRITWCGNRTLVLSAQIDEFIRSGAYQISHEVDQKTGDGTFFVQMVKQIPPEFRIEAGTILHELRAALDHLACVLAIRNGKSAKDTYFPISRSLAVFEDDGIKRKLRNLSDADKKVIAALGKGTYVEMSTGIDISFSEPEFIAGRPVSTVLRDFTRLAHSIVDLFD